MKIGATKSAQLFLIVGACRPEDSPSLDAKD